MSFETEIAEMKARRARAPYPDDMRTRWQTAGFDMAAADRRYLQLSRDIERVSDASDLVAAWRAGEQEIARAAGLAEDDADFWRIAALAKTIAPYGGGQRPA